MKFFIDTADVHEIREAQALGLLDGVTTKNGGDAMGAVKKALGM